MEGRFEQNVMVMQKIPERILNVLQNFESAFIMGGFVSSCLLDEPVNDIDLFCHYDEVEMLLENLDIDPDNAQISFSYPSLSTHVLKTTIDNLSVDIVAYSNKFDPTYHVDFFCRSLCFDGFKITASNPLAFSDVETKTLRRNPYYMMDYGSFQEAAAIATKCCPCSQHKNYDNLTSRQKTMVKNIKKYISKGYHLVYY